MTEAALNSSGFELNNRAGVCANEEPSRSVPLGIAAHWPKGVQQYTPPQALALDFGGQLMDATVGYQSWGTLNATRDNVIWVCHALTGTSDVAGWWSQLFGAGKTLDPERYFIVCVNVLGGCYGSAGPVTHASYAAAYFPRISVFDMVRHQQQLARHLRIRGIALMLGGSMGGFQALAWALQKEMPIRRLALIATSYRQPPQAVALSSMQCQAIRLDPNFKRGFYQPDSAPLEGLKLARQLGHLSYRCEAELNARFDRQQRDDGVYQVDSYLQHQGKKLVARFDANSYLRINQAMNDFAVTPEQLSEIKTPTLVVNIDSDWLYPAAEQQALVTALPDAQYLSVHSDYGHDGFLLNASDFGAQLKDFFEA